MRNTGFSRSALPHPQPAVDLVAPLLHFWVLAQGAASAAPVDLKGVRLQMGHQRGRQTNVAPVGRVELSASALRHVYGAADGQAAARFAQVRYGAGWRVHVH